MRLKVTRGRVVHLSLLMLASRVLAEALIEYTEFSALTSWALGVTLVCQVNSLAVQKGLW